MTTSEKFCLKWNDFQKISSSFKEIREDFCDVTLLGEDYQKIEAHKVILAVSSTKFQELIKQSQHPHPLLYMKGIKGSHLSAVVDFMYHGEVSIAQEDLNDFLSLAEELQLKGLTDTGEEKDDSNVGMKYNKHLKESNKSVLSGKSIFPQNLNQEQNSTQHLDILEEENKSDLQEGREIVPSNIKNMTRNYEDLDEKISSMMNKSNAGWSCNQCGVTNNHKAHLRNHIEGRHIEGISHPCNQCGKLFRSRNSLSNHN